MRLGQEILGLAPFGRLADQTIPKDVLLANHTQIFGLKPLIQGPQGEIDALALDFIRMRDQRPRGHPLIREQRLQPLARAGGIGRQHDRFGFGPISHKIRQYGKEVDLLVLPLGGEIAADLGAFINHLWSRCHRKRIKPQHTVPLHLRIERIWREIELIGRNRLIHRARH